MSNMLAFPTKSFVMRSWCLLLFTSKELSSACKIGIAKPLEIMVKHTVNPKSWLASNSLRGTYLEEGNGGNEVKQPTENQNTFSEQSQPESSNHQATEPTKAADQAENYGKLIISDQVEHDTDAQQPT